MSLSAAYQAGDPQVCAWMGGSSWNGTAIRAWWAQRQGRQHWDYQALAGIHPGLGNPNTALVVTGQQPALGAGPLYTLRKAAQALAVARALRAQGQAAQAVFWVASEDHDHGEANHCDLIARDGRLCRVRTSFPHKGASLRFQSAQGGWENLFTQAQQVLGPGLGAAWLRAHAPEAQEDLGQWCGRVLSRLSAGELICVQAQALRPLWADALRRVLEHWPTQALEGRAQALHAAGYATTLDLRSPPLFHDVASGRRAVSVPEALALLDRGLVEELSPGAGLRPILQQVALPAAAAILGPGELAYHAQLGPMYPVAGAHMPVVVPRLSAPLLSPDIQRALASWGLPGVPDCGAPEPTNLAHPLLAELERIREHWSQYHDPLWRGALQQLARLESRVERGLRAQERKQAGRMPWGVLQARLYPRGQPQDRVLSVFQAVWEWGPGVFAHCVQEAAQAAEQDAAGA